MKKKRTVTIEQIREKYNQFKYECDNYLFFPIELSRKCNDYRLMCEKYIHESVKSFAFYGAETRVVFFLISFFATCYIFRNYIVSLVIGGVVALLSPQICNAIDGKVYEKSKKKAIDSLYDYMIIREGVYTQWLDDYKNRFNQMVLKAKENTSFSYITEETINRIVIYLRNATNRVMYSNNKEAIMYKIIIHENKVEIRSFCSWMTGTTLCQMGFDSMRDAGPYFVNMGLNLQPLGRMALLYYITDKMNSVEKMNHILSKNHIQFRLCSDDDITIYCGDCDDFQETSDFKSIVGAYGDVMLYVKKI